MWFKVTDPETERMKESGLFVLLYSKEWINEDFCPDGIRDGYWDGDGWSIADVDGEGEFYHDSEPLDSPNSPTHWMFHPDRPLE